MEGGATRTARALEVAQAASSVASATTSRSPAPKFLATHPQKIDAALEVAVMAPGVMSAFQQTGLPDPCPRLGLSKGSLGYWNQNRPSTTTSPTSSAPVPPPGDRGGHAAGCSTAKA